MKPATRYMKEKNWYSNTQTNGVCSDGNLKQSYRKWPELHAWCVSFWFNILGYMGYILTTTEGVSIASKCFYYQSTRTSFMFLIFFFFCSPPPPFFFWPERGLHRLCCSFKTTTNLHMQPLWWWTSGVLPCSLWTKCHASSIKCLLTKLKHQINLL